jgi:integral membrane sensor domain MASE1
VTRRLPGITASSTPPLNDVVGATFTGAPLRGIDASRLATDALAFCSVLVGYVAGAYVAFELLSVSSLGAVFFAPAGVSVAAMLLSPTHRWPYIFAAVVIGEVFVDLQMGSYPMWATLGFALANGSEALAGAWIVRRFRRRVDLARLRDLGWFFLGAAGVGPLVGALIGGVTVWFLGTHTAVETVLLWWLGDSLGVIIVGGAILAVFATDQRRAPWLELVGALALTATVAFAVHWLVDEPVGFIAVIPLMALSARLGTRAAAAATALITGIAISAWVISGGDALGLPGTGGMVVVKLQLLSMAAAALLVAAEASELERASQQAGYRLETVELLRRALAPEQDIHHAHVDAEGASRSASRRLEVGGDWYDVIESDDGVVAIVIGDVVGHGEEALVTMGKLRFAAQALVMLGRDSGHVLDWLAEYARQLEGRPFATCFVAFFDPTTGTLNYSSAGHPPGLLGLADGSWRWLSEARSAPIGVPATDARPTATVEFPHEATLVVYTDGVVERAGEVIDTGLARMFDAVVDAPDGSVTALLDRVAAATSDDASFVRVHLRR